MSYRMVQYRGDSFLGGLVKGALKVGGAILGATPVGQVVRNVVTMDNGATSSRAGAPTFSMAPGAATPNLPTISRMGQQPTNVPGMTVGVSPLGTVGVAGERPAGYHRNRTGYYTRQGFVPAGSRWVRNRKLNPLNPRALRKGLRRANNFAKIARGVIRFVSPQAPKGRAIFKKGRRGGR